MRKRRTAAAAVAVILGVLMLPSPGATARSTPTFTLPASWQSSCRLSPAPAPVPTDRISVQRDIAYDAGVELDLYLPANGTPLRPGVVAIHGGGWRVGSRSGMAWTATRLAKAGFVVAAPDYTLSTTGRPGFPLELAEVRAAVRWLRAHAASYGVDPARIGALGSSAGGHLALLAADSGTGPCTTGSRVAGVVAWSAPTDLTRLSGCGSGSCDLATLTNGFVGCSNADCPQRWQTASPVTWASADDPPALLYTSTEEFIPMAQTTEMVDALHHRSVPSWLVRLPGHRHASDYRTDAIDSSIAFLTTVLTGDKR